jgi:hypothetical protein
MIGCGLTGLRDTGFGSGVPRTQGSRGGEPMGEQCRPSAALAHLATRRADPEPAVPSPAPSFASDAGEGIGTTTVLGQTSTAAACVVAPAVGRGCRGSGVAVNAGRPQPRRLQPALSYQPEGLVPRAPD